MAVVKNSKIAMEEINKYIEHTVLSPTTTQTDVEKLCEEAIYNNFLGVCVPPYYSSLAKKIIENTPVKLVTVVGFPMGYNSINAKVEDAKKAVNDGVDEIDMVINLAAFKSQNYNHVSEDIERIATICRLNNKPIKVIIESGILTQNEISKAVEICINNQVDFIKTSTGFNGSGASVETVKYIKELIENTSIQIKASGGIRDYQFAQDLIDAGANRIGTSSSLKIIKNRND